ncbi:MAG: restriction endonuclease [Burkholderiales bacterium]|nr:restriction endonuclease [Burkholderiales bacterium]
MAARERQNLFNVLKNSPWWMSAAVGAAIFIGLQAFFPVGLAFFAALPFLVIALYALWRQLRTPGEARVAQALEKLRGLSWEEFAAAMEEAYRRSGHQVSALQGGAADFLVEKKGRSALVSCKRWKAAQTGVSPLRALVDARRAREAHECVFVCARELSPNALDFAATHAVQILAGVELVRFLRRQLR